MTDGRSTSAALSPFAITRLNDGSTQFKEFAGAFRFELAIRGFDDQPIKTSAFIVTEGYFDVLGKPMFLGRGFLPEEHVQPPQFVIISYELWRTAFNSDPSIIGRGIPAGPGFLTVVGVTAPEHNLPAGANVWLAFSPDPNQTAFFLEGIARLSPGATLATGKAELAATARRFAEESPSFDNRTLTAEDLKTTIVGDASTKLLILLGAAGVLLLIACVNVMNLLLSRGETKSREVALRAAVGATPWRLVRQLLVESMVLSALGAAVGVGVTWIGLEVLNRVHPAGLPRLAEIGIDGRVVLFAVAATAFTGLAFGLLPTARLAMTDIRTLMGGSSRGSSGGRRAARVFAGLVAGQTCLSVGLVIAAGLLVRSYQGILHTDGGFDPEGVVVMDTNIPRSLVPDYGMVSLMYEQLVQKIGELPGVDAVGATSSLPLGEQLDFFFSARILGQPETDQPERARMRVVTSGFFQAGNIHLREGRFLEDADRADTRAVAVVNEAFVHRFLDGGRALGRTILISGGPLAEPTSAVGYIPWREMEIVGVVGDVRYLALDKPAEPAIYMSHAQSPFRRMFVTVKASGGNVARVTTGMREAFRALDSQLPVDFTTWDRVVSDSLSNQRMTMLLLLAFALAAATLAAVGLYGVISYSVRERTTEMAIRAALGASSRKVLALSMYRGLVMSAIGIAGGVVVAILARRIIATQLYEISATDPVVLVAAPLLFAVLAFVAVLVPALRTTRINLLVTLRSD